MKVRIIDRILVLFYGLIGLFLIVSRAVGFDWEAVVMAKANGLMEPAFVKASVYAVLAFFALYTLYIIWFALHTTKDKEHYVSVASSDNGATRVSVGALNQLVAHSIGSVEGIQDVQACVYDENDSVKVRMNMNVTGNVNIPGASLLIKDAVRSRIETVSGIPVRDIDITVGKILPAEGDICTVPAAAPQEKTEVAAENAEPAMNVQADAWMPLDDALAEDEVPETEAEENKEAE